MTTGETYIIISPRIVGDRYAGVTGGTSSNYSGNAGKWVSLLPTFTRLT